MTQIADPLWLTQRVTNRRRKEAEVWKYLVLVQAESGQFIAFD